MTRWWNFEFPEAEISNKEITTRKINQVFKLLLDFKNHIESFRQAETLNLMIEVLLSAELQYRAQLQKILKELNLLAGLDKDSFKMLSKVMNIPEDKAMELLQGGKKGFKFFILNDCRFKIYITNYKRNLDIIVVDSDDKDGKPMSILNSKSSELGKIGINILAQTIYDIGTIQKNTSNDKDNTLTSKIYSTSDVIQQISRKLKDRYISINDKYVVNSYYKMEDGSFHTTTIYTTTKNYEFQVNVLKRNKGFKDFDTLNYAIYLHNLEVGFQTSETRLIEIRRDLII